MFMERFRSYLINPIEVVGRGGFGYVERIELYNEQNRFCGLYARKILNPNKDILRSVSIEDLKRRFIREVIYQSKCVHENVMYVYLFNKHIDAPFFVMDLAESDLQKDIENNLLDEEEKIKIINMIIRGVKKIHDKGYLHRDMKPQNILKSPSGHYQISDFGLVKNTDSTRDTAVLTAIGQMMGTRRYMAPEILYDAEYSVKTDIYALGKIIDDLNVKNENIRNICEKCTAMEKENRYENIGELILDFESFNFGLAS